jgi:hypothetical protein
VEIFSAFVQEFRNWESAWALEALFVIVYEIRVLAEKVCFVLIKLNFFVTVWLRLFSAQNCKLLSKSFFFPVLTLWFPQEGPLVIWSSAVS